VTTERCFDCFADVDREARFVVLKQLRDWPEIDGEPMHPAGARAFGALLLDPVLVCGECAGWYADEAIHLGPEDPL
jgi:hypothetical protein